MFVREFSAPAREKRAKYLDHMGRLRRLYVEYNVRLDFRRHGRQYTRTSRTEENNGMPKLNRKTGEEFVEAVVPHCLCLWS